MPECATSTHMVKRTYASAGSSNPSIRERDADNHCSASCSLIVSIPVLWVAHGQLPVKTVNWLHTTLSITKMWFVSSFVDHINWFSRFCKVSMVLPRWSGRDAEAEVGGPAVQLPTDKYSQFVLENPKLMTQVGLQLLRSGFCPACVGRRNGSVM